MPCLHYPNLRSDIDELFISTPLLPNTSDSPKLPEDLRLPIPFDIVNNRDNKLFGRPLVQAGNFVTLNNMDRANSWVYFSWLQHDLGIRPYTVLDWFTELKNLEYRGSISPESDDLASFYEYLSKFAKSSVPRNYGDRAVEDTVNSWNVLSTAPIVLNKSCHLIPAFVDGRPNIYTMSNSAYKNLDGKHLVNQSVSSRFLDVWKKLNIDSYDNLDYVKQYVLPRYLRKFELESVIPDDTAISDMNHIVELARIDPKCDLSYELKDYSFVRSIGINVGKGHAFYRKPSQVWMPVSVEGVCMEAFIEGLLSDYTVIDLDFYKRNGIDISLDIAKRLGIHTVLTSFGSDSRQGKMDASYSGPESKRMTRKHSIVSIGDYRWDIKIEMWKSNRAFISSGNTSPLSLFKSREMLKALLYNHRRLRGEVVHKIAENPQRMRESSKFFMEIESLNWLYRADGKLGSLHMKKSDLESRIYDDLGYPDSAYGDLGFEVDEDITITCDSSNEDRAVAVQKIIEGMEPDDAQNLIRRIMDSMSISSVPVNKAVPDELESEEFFEASDDPDDSFPVDDVKNPEKFRNSVFADVIQSNPILYERKFRSIRTSKNPLTKMAIRDEYTNYSGGLICQMCLSLTSEPEVVEIFNSGYEIRQMHLCLCRNCAAKYKAFIAAHGDMKKIWSDALEGDISDHLDQCGGYAVHLSSEIVLMFTQRHLIEVSIALEVLNSDQGHPKDIV